MKPPMLHTISKVTTVRNTYGDYLVTGRIELSCHFRDINEQVTGGVNETVQSDAMCWLEPDAPVDRGDLLEFGDTCYRVERVTKARRLRETPIQFLKLDLLKYGQVGEDNILSDENGIPLTNEDGEYLTT